VQSGEGRDQNAARFAGGLVLDEALELVLLGVVSVRYGFTCRAATVSARSSPGAATVDFLAGAADAA
jgi:hypothetical protein